ncbi:MAG: FAD-binding protein [Treponema sp.]|jgi:succinate dehydrogenase/fumarate reductase flavoprotein subunit|nr:FAD-binding protein [Treponema sp.]
MISPEEAVWISCDILVIGAGAAGLTAACRAAEKGAAVVLAVKGSCGKTGVRGSGASCCGATEYGVPGFPKLAKDSLRDGRLYEAIIGAGLGITDPELAKTLVEKIPEAERQCETWGVRWGLSGSETLGYPLARALFPVLKKRVKIIENIFVFDIILDENGICAGAAAVLENDPVLIEAKAVIIASGGIAGIYEVNVHPPCVTGDGLAMALRAGAKLKNMEFAQFFPVTVFPQRNLFHFWNKRGIGNIKNRYGKEFLRDYLPPDITPDQCAGENLSHAPFSTRDSASRYLAIGIMKEILKGNAGSHGGVFADLRGQNDDGGFSGAAGDGNAAERQRAFLLSRGIDIERELVELGMGFQCGSGGIEIDKNGCTGVPGLYAAGEAACGMYGADRIGGTMLASCVVWGLLSSEHAAEYSRRRAREKKAALKNRITDQLPDLFENPGFREGSAETFAAEKNRGEEPGIKKRLKHGAWKYLSVIKTESGIKKILLETGEAAGERVSGGKTAGEKIELKNQILITACVAESALSRKESRGSFYREDFPDMDPGVPVYGSKLFLDNGKIRTETCIPDKTWQGGGTAIALKRWG